MKKAWVLSYPLSAQRRLIRLGGYPGWSESSQGAHSFCLFCHEAAHLYCYTRSCNTFTKPANCHIHLHTGLQVMFLQFTFKYYTSTPGIHWKYHFHTLYHMYLFSLCFPVIHILLYVYIISMYMLFQRGPHERLVLPNGSTFYKLELSEDPRYSAITEERQICKWKIGEKKKWTNKGTNKQQQPYSCIHDTCTDCPHVYQVSTF